MVNGGVGKVACKGVEVMEKVRSKTIIVLKLFQIHLLHNFP